MIAASLLAADFTNLGEEVKAVEAAGADWIHFDITDGHFVENLTMGPQVVEAVRPITQLPLDVHLMIEEPVRFIDSFARAGADSISVHVETTRHLIRVLEMIRSYDVKAGVVLSPSVAPEQLRWVLDYVSHILVLTVSPGFGGQTLLARSYDRIRLVADMVSDHGVDILIQADGGVNRATIAPLARAGVDVFTVGSALFSSPDYGATMASFRKEAGR